MLKKIKLRYYLYCSILVVNSVISLPVHATDSIAGFGRIIPSGGMLNLAPTLNEPIEKILVSARDNVSAGDELAYLSSREQLKSEVELASQNVDLAEIQYNEAILNKQFDIKSQNIRVLNLKQKYNSSKDRLENLYKNEAEKYVSPDTIKHMEADIQQAKTDYDLASIALSKLEKSLELSVNRAEKELDVAKQKLELARIKYSKSIVRSPIDGTIMKVFGKPGEIAENVIFSIADLENTYVIAEIYESDTLRLKVGQKAKISSAALPVAVNGTVTSIGTMIFNNSINSVDPAAQTNSRIIEVLILLDKNPYTERMINLQVDVLIFE